MGALEDATGLHQQLMAAWKSANADQCRDLLKKLKIALMKLSLVPSAAAPGEKELLIARDVMEVGAQWAIQVQDIDAFERYMAQLKVYYFDYAEKLPRSETMYELLGLNLLRLLSQNAIAEFHTELERLEPALLQDNPFIRHSVTLEQHLMEGAFNKVFLSSQAAPAKSYSFFLDMLGITIRDEIATCCEVAYDSLRKADLAKLLYLEDASRVQEVIDAHHEWRVEGDKVVFPQRQAVKADVPTNKLINRTLEYAKEMEQIV